MKTNQILGFEDPVDSWTHLFGALAVGILLVYLFRRGGIGRRYPVPIIIYGFSCIFLLSMSGVYHMISREFTARYVLRILDHAGIFILIAGTLISVHLVLFSGFMKWGITIIALVIAALGITFGSIYFNELPKYTTHIVYLVFGWLGLVSIIGIWKLKGATSFKYLLYGGLAYTIGAVIDWMQYPILLPGYFEAHELFHVAVLIGIAFHWVFLFQSIRSADQES
ncbi:hemolysin III family protein [Fulvivirga ulvae]|uniref:PAQR family membrane homeostasis protein TrhA n=1 Tax=Fulvivirga ulvae TaxID=2904245 RepID=UPI001F2424C9|nr:hemolysin III family protein [Fulvivirga ulvae]UII32794.1 hemolysin III family protein [Fulvivirga ulvae]